MPSYDEFAERPGCAAEWGNGLWRRGCASQSAADDGNIAGAECDQAHDQESDLHHGMVHWFAIDDVARVRPPFSLRRIVCLRFSSSPKARA